MFYLLFERISFFPEHIYRQKKTDFLENQSKYHLLSINPQFLKVKFLVVGKCEKAFIYRLIFTFIFLLSDLLFQRDEYMGTYLLAV